MRKSLIVCLSIAFAMAVPVFGQKWWDLSDEEIDKLVAKREVTEIVRIQKNSARPKGDRAGTKEMRVIDALIQTRDFELLELLLKNGLPTQYMPDYYYHSLLSKCIPEAGKKGDYEMFKFLLPWCEITDLEITSLVSENAVDFFKLLVKNKTNLKRGAVFYSIAGGGAYYPSLFHYAVDARAHEIAKLIYQSHPDLDPNLPAYCPDYESAQYDPNGRSLVSYAHTALDDALEDGNQEMAEWLRGLGARTFVEIIPGRLAKDPQRSIQVRAKSTTDRLRVREREDLGAKVVGYLDKGEEALVLNLILKKVTIDGRSSHWYFIAAKKNVFGWVFGGYLEFPQ